MGLQGQLSDVSSDSIPLMLIALLATLFKHVRSLLIRFSDSDPNLTVDDAPPASVSVLSDQLNLNRILSHRYSSSAAAAATDCIVCLSKLKEGEEVRKLDCRHVFHKKCLEGWLQHLNFNCPLCRSPLIKHGGGGDSILLHSALIASS